MLIFGDFTTTYKRNYLSWEWNSDVTSWSEPYFKMRV